MQCDLEDYNYYAPGPFSSWFVTLGVRVDEWVLNPALRAHFRRQLANWYKEHRAGKGPVLDFPPYRALTLPEKYAVLSAIHDLVCKNTCRLELWDTNEKWTRNPARDRAAILWTIVKHRVRDRAKHHRQFINRVFADVEKDICENEKQDISNTRVRPALGVFHPNRTHRVQNVEPKLAKAPKRRKRKRRETPTAKQLEAQALRLRGLSFKEIGEQLGITQEAARKHVLRAEEILKGNGRSARASQNLPSDPRGQDRIEDHREKIPGDATF